MGTAGVGLKLESPLTMKRITVFAALALASLPVLGASAQSLAPQADAPPCPSEPLAIYYASGEAAISAEGSLLLGRVGGRAIACQPDSIDLITRIDSGVDGERAVELALARLSSVAADLVAQGVPSESIRVAARAGRDVFPPGLSEVEIHFRKAGNAADDVGTGPSRRAAGEPKDSI